MNLYHLYNEEIMRLAKSGIGAGQVEDGIARQEINPLCGDECCLTMSHDKDRIIKLAHHTRGCVLCLAAAAKLTMLAADNPSLSAMRDLTDNFLAMLKHGKPPPAGLELFTPVAARKSRHNCVLLPFNALSRMWVEDCG